MVVLPAPGGATSTADSESASACRRLSIVSSTGSSVIGIRSGEGGCTGERGWIAGGRNGRSGPRRCGGNRLGNRSPFDGRPSLGCCGNRAIGTNEDERGQALEAECTDGRSVRIRKNEKLTRQRSEVLLHFSSRGSDDQARSCCRTTEGAQYPRGRFQYPGTFVCVRVQHDCGQVKCRQPFTQRTRALVVGSMEDGFEHQIDRRIGYHEVNGSGWLPVSDSQWLVARRLVTRPCETAGGCRSGRMCATRFCGEHGD